MDAFTIVQEIISFFKVKKNLINFAVLLILAITLPFALNLAKNTQIFKSRAADAPVVFTGPNVGPPRAGSPNKVVKPSVDASGSAKWSVDLQFTAPTGPITP